MAENIYMGREPKRLGVLNRHLFSQTQNQLKALGLNISPHAKVKDLGIGQQQLIEIAKGLSQNPQILVLDEPTSALNPSEIKTLLRILHQLRERGVSSVLISHKLDEVLEISDWITILRDGKTVASYPRTDATEKRIVAEMVGREMTHYYPQSHRVPGDLAFSVNGLIRFSVRKREILGIFGLMGAGRTELLMALYGLEGKQDSQKISQKISVTLEDHQTVIRNPEDAIKNGIAYVPEDRKRHGLVLDQTVLKNMSLSSLKLLTRFGRIQRGRESHLGMEYLKKLKIKTSSIHSRVRSLSGGNQQKVVLAKCLLSHPKVLFLDEPTRGIDVGAKAEIYQRIHDLAEEGMAIVMVSSELPEILGMSDRILVMRQGRFVAEFNAAEATQEKIMAAATGANRSADRSKEESS